MRRFAKVEVRHEEVIIHPTAYITQKDNIYIDARVIGDVEIEGKKYTFNQVVKFKVELEEKLDTES